MNGELTLGFFQHPDGVRRSCVVIGLAPATSTRDSPAFALIAATHQARRETRGQRMLHASLLVSALCHYTRSPVQRDYQRTRYHQRRRMARLSCIMIANSEQHFRRQRHFLSGNNLLPGITICACSSSISSSLTGRKINDTQSLQRKVRFGARECVETLGNKRKSSCALARHRSIPSWLAARISKTRGKQSGQARGWPRGGDLIQLHCPSIWCWTLMVSGDQRWCPPPPHSALIRIV